MKSYLASLTGQKTTYLHADNESTEMIFKDKSRLPIFNRHQIPLKDINTLTESTVKLTNKSKEK